MITKQEFLEKSGLNAKIMDNNKITETLQQIYFNCYKIGFYDGKLEK